MKEWQEQFISWLTCCSQLKPSSLLLSCKGNYTSDLKHLTIQTLIMQIKPLLTSKCLFLDCSGSLRFFRLSFLELEERILWWWNSTVSLCLCVCMLWMESRLYRWEFFGTIMGSFLNMVNRLNLFCFCEFLMLWVYVC